MVLVAMAMRIRADWIVMVSVIMNIVCDEGKERMTWSDRGGGGGGRWRRLGITLLWWSGEDSR